MSEFDFRWNRVVTRRDVIKLGLLATVAPRQLFAAQTAWSFAVFSDTHYGVKGHVEKNEPLLREIGALNPAFAFNVGDLTERAWPFEFDEATQAFGQLPYKVHVAPGNHDVRWAPGGPIMFNQRIGPMRQFFQHRGCAFLLLDSTVPLSHFGHIGGPQQRWITEQLSTIGRDVPLFVYFHHPVGRPSGIDDNARLFEALAPFNTKVIFNAHGHADLLWDWNGVAATMSKGLYQGSYQLATVDPDAGVVRLARRTATAPALTPFAEIPLARTSRRAALPTPATTQRAATGGLRKVWQQPLGGGVMSELLVHDGTLYVSCMDGALYALNERDGGLRWKAQTADYLHSTPTIAGRNIIVGSADGSVYAFARSDGRQQWMVKTGGPVYASAAIASGIAAIASGDGVVYGIDNRNGTVRWRFTLEPGPSSFSQSPAGTDGKRFYIGAWDEKVYALDVKTGREIWRYRATERGFYFSPAIARPAVGKDRIFIPSNDNSLHALDARTGAVVWKQSAPADKFGYSSPLLADGRIYIGSLGDKGEVHCMDAATGKIIWTTPTGETIYESSPARAGDAIAIGSVTGLLSVLRMKDGTVAGSYRFPPGLFVSTPAGHGNRIYAATFAEEVAAFDLVA